MSYFLSLDVGGTAIKYGILTDNYKVIDKSEIKTSEYLQHFLADIEEIYNNVKNNYNISGVAVSVPGRVGLEGKMISGGCLGYLKDFNLKQWFEKLSGLPVEVENDGICAAMAEHRAGALSECSDGIVTIFGTGIAGGIIIDNKVRRGFNSMAGEFSFIIMGAGFYNEETLWAADNGDYMLRSLVSNVKNIPLDNLDGRVIFKMANAGDREVNIVIDNYTGLIARNLFNLQAILDVQKIAVGGGISSEPLFINGIKKNLKMYGEMADSSIPLPEIVKCKFGRDANMIGALVKLQENENT